MPSCGDASLQLGLGSASLGLQQCHSRGQMSPSGRAAGESHLGLCECHHTLLIIDLLPARVKDTGVTILLRARVQQPAHHQTKGAGRPGTLSWTASSQSYACNASAGCL